ncbi:MAG: malto-oligosyltrehalose trehalohydrolase [Verrucomicrobiota bacterium]|nr:malto-oligosyltrehalose trehalohydrolase [Verrucomicrobiota bacterium]
MNIARRYPIGAEYLGPGETHFRVWAPKAERLAVVLDSGEKHSLDREDNGYFSGVAPADVGALYRYQLDGEKSYSDPASRSQPEGVHGPSAVVNPRQFAWTDQAWRGVELRGQVIYEMHIGTFTREGTWRAAAAQLQELHDSGITLIEMMPIAGFPGEFGWGYDGVNLFCPCGIYGEPDDLRAFINEAHAVGIAVILDVVYNHLGPEGNYLSCFADAYFTDRYRNDWGAALNFDGPDAGPVREFFITNARCWIDEYHFDGFRFDATQDIKDASDEYILGAIGIAAREAAGDRSLIFIAENEAQKIKTVLPCEQGGDGFDGIWNDDFHHAALVALTGKREAYYTDYKGTPQEFVSSAKYGFLFQGQRYKWQKGRRGTPTFGLPPETFVAFIENHDQVANTADGARLRFRTSAGKYRAMTALLLLGPWTPMLFQGQEFGATSPFTYFTDVEESLHESIRKGRTEFLAQFPSIRKREVVDKLPIPWDRAPFERCKLDFSERATNRAWYDLHRDLLRLRRDDPRFSQQKLGMLDGAVLGRDAFVLRYFGEDGDDRLLVVNLGRALRLDPAPEPLLAPPFGAEWAMIWNSEAAPYGGAGDPPPLDSERNWRIPAECAVVLQPRLAEDEL